VAVDGVSLTVNAIRSNRFSVMLIPETRRATALGDKGVGAPVNLEGDVIGKYVARLLARRGGAGGGVDEAFLKENGFACAPADGRSSPAWRRWSAPSRRSARGG